MKIIWILPFICAGLIACSSGVPKPESGFVADAQWQTEPPVAFENTYTAENTYARELANFPFIEVASRVVPPEVEAHYNLTYVTYDKRALQLDLFRPAAAIDSRSAVVLVHGGGWRSGYRENLVPLAIALAQRGYIAATISYRLAPEAQYPAAIHDVKAAVRWVRSHAELYGIDPERIAIGGSSAGGQIASLVGVTNGVERFDPQAQRSSVSSAVQVILNIDGLSDFTSEEARKHEDDPSRDPSSAGSWFGGRYAEKRELWHDASPTYYVHADMPPILYLNSARERFGVGRDEMIEKMKPLGIPYQVTILPETPHTYWLFDPWLQPAAGIIADFLDRYLAGNQGVSQ
jgi:acetyl esterase/lipase